MSASPALSRRCLSLWLPTLPTDRLQRCRAPSRPPDASAPLVLVSKTQGAQRVTACDARARAAGLEAGMMLAQARAMVPDVAVRDHAPDADARLLEAIADWADRYTPLVGRHPPDGLLLDITGAAHLKGGEAALCADLLNRLARQGFAATAAIAPSPGAAWALARFRGDERNTPFIVPPEATQKELDATLSPLPVSGLRLTSDTVAALHRVGLKRIGDLIGRPRAALAARFGVSLIVRLDQARGIDDEAIGPRQPVPPAEVEQTCPDPILTTDAVIEACRELSERLVAMLTARGQGVTSLQLAVYRVDGLVKRIDLRLASPCRDAGIMVGLIALRLGALDDPLDPGFGYDLVRLAATNMAASTPENRSLPALGLTAAATELADHRARLIDRLTARFGSSSISVHTAAATHIPEQADRLVNLQASLGGREPQGARAATSRLAPVRPLRLFEPPEPVEVMAEVPDGPPLNIRWRRRPLRIVAAEGPERVAPEWWTSVALASGPQEQARTRDYWRVQDTTGRRLWLYREGLYDTPSMTPGAAPADTLPRWYVHGLFA